MAGSGETEDFLPFVVLQQVDDPVASARSTTSCGRSACEALRTKPIGASSRCWPRFRQHRSALGYRVWAFPFLFWGIDAAKAPYFAFFPVGARFTSFSAVIESRSRSSALHAHHDHEVETYDVLWPIVSWGDGARSTGFTYFLSTGAGSKGEYEKRFVLWPIWTSRASCTPAARAMDISCSRSSA